MLPGIQCGLIDLLLRGFGTNVQVNKKNSRRRTKLRYDSPLCVVTERKWASDFLRRNQHYLEY